VLGIVFTVDAGDRRRRVSLTLIVPPAGRRRDCWSESQRIRVKLVTPRPLHLAYLWGRSCVRASSVRGLLPAARQKTASESSDQVLDARRQFRCMPSVRHRARVALWPEARVVGHLNRDNTGSHAIRRCTKRLARANVVRVIDFPATLGSPYVASRCVGGRGQMLGVTGALDSVMSARESCGGAIG